MILVTKKQIIHKTWTIINVGKEKMPPFEVRTRDNHFKDQGIRVMRKLKPGQSMKIMMSLVAPNEEGSHKASFHLFLDGNVQVKQSRLDVKMKVLEQ